MLSWLCKNIYYEGQLTVEFSLQQAGGGDNLGMAIVLSTLMSHRFASSISER